MLLRKSRRILRKDELRSVLSIADHPDGTRDVDGAADAVFSFGNEKDTEGLFGLDPVDGRLKGDRNVGLAVGGDAGEILRREEKGPRVIGFLGID